MPKYIEECYILSASVIKKDLRKIRNGEEISGQVPVCNENRKMQLNYWSKASKEEDHLVVSFLNSEPQEILLQAFNLRYGARSYFTCECGKRGSSLYLHPENEAEGFKCRKCLNLSYKLSSINKRSVYGPNLYQGMRMNKFFNDNKKVPRILYKGKETKTFLAYAHKMKKIGMIKRVNFGLKQIAEIKSVSKRISTISEYLCKNESEPSLNTG